MRYLVPIGIYVLLTTFAVVDIAQSPVREPYRMSKPTWFAIVVFAPFIGALAWIGARLRRKPDEQPMPRGPVGPEDDPAFRRWLDEQARRNRRDAKSKDDQQGPTEGA